MLSLWEMLFDLAMHESGYMTPTLLFPHAPAYRGVRAADHVWETVFRL